MLELLFWPALIGYGEAAVAYSSPRFTRARDLGRADRLARCRRRCSPSRPRAPTASRGSTWAGSLNLFVWLVVGAYLIWGCRPRYRLLGLAVMPLAAVLFLVAGLGGGTEAGDAVALRQPLPRPCTSASCSPRSPGFTLAAALAGLYLLEERRLQAALGRHPAAASCRRSSTLERVTSQAITSRCRCSRSGSRSGSCGSTSTAAASTR